MEKLARFNDATVYTQDRAAKMRSFDEYWEIPVPEDDGSADIVRARLGLPTRDG